MTSSRSRAVVTLIGAAAIGTIGAMLNSPTVATTGPVLVMAWSVEHHRRRSRAEARTLARLLPSLVDNLIQQLRSGRSLSQACSTLLGGPADVAPGKGATASDQHRAIREAFAPMASALRGRRTLAEAAGSLLPLSDPSVRLFAVTVRVLAMNGGPAVPALQRLRHTLIGVAHGADQADAQSSQAMASAGLMAVSPIVVAAVVGALHGEAARLYLFEPVGAVCVFTAVALSCLGWWWMQRKVARLEQRIA